MKKLYSIFTLMLTLNICYAQNLVPNPDFESYSGCPDNYSEFDSLLFWFSPHPKIPGAGTPDYYNQCASSVSSVSVPDNWGGYQQALSGVGYGGIYLFQAANLNTREYIEVPLTAPLVANSCYHFEMYVNLCDMCSHTTDDIGVFFSDTAITNFSAFFQLTPQIVNTNGNTFDSLSWKIVSGDYAAHGGESYLLIGNFKDDASIDTVLYNPSASFIASYIYIDDVSLVLTSCAGVTEFNNDDNIHVYPNPVSDKLQIKANSSELMQITLYDDVSKKLFQQPFTNSYTLDTEKFAKGIYLYEVREKNVVVKKGKLVKQ